MVAALLGAGIDVHCLRDPTRGGLASALNEIAVDAGGSIEVDEKAIPVSDAVAGACELLGLDPLYVACEGRWSYSCPSRTPGESVPVAKADLKDDQGGEQGLHARIGKAQGRDTE